MDEKQYLERYREAMLSSLTKGRSKTSLEAANTNS